MILPALTYLPATLAALFSFPLGIQNQQPLLSHAESIESRNFSVGFSLQSSYGAAAVIFEGADGDLETYTRVYKGCSEYQRVMAKLSLKSSIHVAPPYDNDGQYCADQPRQAARTALKAVGLPASYEVGVLAQVIKHLQSQLETDFSINISEAVITSSHLLALYQDDLQDAAFHVGVQHITPRGQFHPILWETASAYAGYGLGLCEHWRDEERCQEEELQLPDIPILAVHYSRNALTVSLAEMLTAASAWEPDYRRVENFTLGSDAIRSYPSSDGYWEGVKDALLETMRTFPLFPRPQKIMLTGDMVHDDFMNFLKTTLNDYLGKIPPILSVDPVVVSAKGAAEFMRREPAPYSV